MKKRTKNLLIILCVIAGVIVAASVILRLVLTKERLTEMIVPRIEERTGAEIEFGDIGIKFPFGFGVSLDDLRLSKDIPSAGRFELAARRFTADASLMSLIRQKPEIRSVTVGGASIAFTGDSLGINVEVDGLGARLSMQTSESAYVLDPRLSAEKISIVLREVGKRFDLPHVSFSGRLEAAIDMSKMAISDGKLALADFVDLKIEGEIGDPQGAGEFAVRARTSELDAKKLVDMIQELGLMGAVPGSDPGEMEGEAAFSVMSGRVGIDMRASGMISAPSEIAVTGKLDLEKVALGVAAGPEIAMGGAVEFSDSRITSKGLSLETERSRMEAAFEVDIDKNEKKPRYVSFDVQSKIDLADASAFMPAGDSEPLTGILKISLKGGAPPGKLKHLFPLKDGESSPERISQAWKDLDLEGAVEISADELPGQEGPSRITSLEMSSSIHGGSVNILNASFDMGGRPWKVKGEMKNVMPALAELMFLAEKNDLPDTPGPVLDDLVNSPDMSIDFWGRAFDTEAYKGEAEKTEADGAHAATAPEPDPLVANPLTLLMLKKTFVSISIDSIITKGAVFTSLDAKGRISDGVLRAHPVTVDYAGGKGSGRLVADLRDPSRIDSDIDIDFTGIDAGKALSGYSNVGKLVSGSFAMKLDGRFTAGPGVDILKNLTATGRATSTSGTVDFSMFMAPIRSAGINISSIERFDFHEWTEKFVIEQGRVTSEMWDIKSSSGDWDIAGSFGFDGTLDYKAGLVITPAQQTHMKDLSKYGAIIDLFKDDGGNILLMLDIGGTAKQPKVRLDQSKAKEKATSNLIEGAKDKLKDLFKK